MKEKKLPIHPIYEENAICPLCKKMQTFPNIRHQSYSVIKTDPDTHSNIIKWSHTSYNDINPNHYYIWTCSDCLYTDKISNFKSTKQNNDEISRFRDISGTMFKSHDRVFDELGTYINGTPTLHEKALAQHLLYIYVLEQSIMTVTVHNELGKIYLRTAWLFRDDKPTHSVSIPDILSDFFTEQFSFYLNEFNVFQKASNVFSESISEKQKELCSLGDTVTSLLEEDINSFQDEINVHVKKLNQLHQTMLVSHRKRMDKIHETGSHEKESLMSILQLVRFDWKAIPDTEEAAILKSNMHYRKALKLGLHQETPAKLFQLFQVVAYGYYRSQHYKTLLTYCDEITESFNSVKLQLTNTIGIAKRKTMHLEKKIIDAKNSKIKMFENDIEQDKALKTQIIKTRETAKKGLKLLQENVETFKNIRKRTFNRFQEKEFERMINIVKQNPNQSKSEYLELVKKEQIPPSIIKKYFNNKPQEG